MKIKICILITISLLLLSSINIVSASRGTGSPLEVIKNVCNREFPEEVDEINVGLYEAVVFKIHISYNAKCNFEYKLTNFKVVDFLPEGLEYQYTLIKFRGEAYLGESGVAGNKIFFNFTQDWGFEIFDGETIHLEICAKTVGYGININTAYASGVILHPSGIGIKHTDSDTASVIIDSDTEPPITTCSLEGEMGDNDWFLSDVEIFLHAEDVESDIQEIYYQLDNGIWYSNSGDSVSIMVSEEGSHMINYYSSDEYNNCEDIKTTKFKIDKSKPVTKSDVKGNMGKNGWFVDKVSITLDAGDAISGVESTFYNINGGEFQKYKTPIELLESGVYVIVFYSTDYAGHIEDEVKIKIKIDADSPKTSAILPITTDCYQGMYVYHQTVIVALDAIDETSGIGSTYYRITSNPVQEGSWKEYGGPFIVFGRGLYSLEFYSIDKAGNQEITKTTQFIIL